MSGTEHIWEGRADSDAVTAIERMFAAVDNPKPRELLEWLYLDSPGGAFVALAHDERGRVDGAGGLYAAFPVTFEVDGKAITWIQSFDTLTLPDFRGRGLFVELAKRVYRMAESDGVGGVYGVPNDSSMPGFQRRLDWKILDPLPMLARPIGSRYLRARLGLRSPAVASSSGVPNTVDGVERQYTVPRGLDRLYKRWEDRPRIGIRRDQAYADWRFARPGTEYVTFVARDDSGEITAFGATTIQLKHGCSLGYVMEHQVAKGHEASGRRVMGAMVSELKSRGADLVLAWSLGGTARSALRRAGFIPLPERARPISLHFGGRAFTDDTPAADRGAWYISYLDSDTV